jgi:hypothetical protein
LRCASVGFNSGAYVLRPPWPPPQADNRRSDNRLVKRLWIVPWALVGVGYTAFFLSLLGVFLLPVALLAAVLLHRVPAARPASMGVVSGVGAVMFYGALVDRSADECSLMRASGEPCTDHWDSWPVAIVGAALIAIGVIGCVVRQRFARGSVSESAIA